MKKLIVLSASTLIMFSCTAIQTQQQSYNNRVVVPVTAEVLPQNNFILTESGIVYLQDLLTKDFAQKNPRSYLASQIGSPLEIYAGENLSITFPSANRVKLVSAPIQEGFELNIQNNTLLFNSIYQGTYMAEVYSDFTLIGTVTIKNKLKYNINEAENYAIITNSYRKLDFPLLLKAADVYSVAFPNSSKQKELSFMVIEGAARLRDYNLINSKINFLKSNFTLTEAEKIRIFNLEKNLIPKNFAVNNYYLEYNVNNLKLNTEVKNFLATKATLTAEETLFLQNLYNDTGDTSIMSILSRGNSLFGSDTTTSPEISQIIVPVDEVIGEAISTEAANGLLKDGFDALNRRSYNEALVLLNKAEKNVDQSNLNNLLFYKGKAYFSLNDYDNAFTNLEKVTSESPNFSESLYYLGVISHEKGNIDEAKGYLRRSREHNPSSTWGRKSSIYLLKL